MESTPEEELLQPDSVLFPVRSHCIYLNHSGVSPIPSPTAAMLHAYADESSTRGAAAYPIWLGRLKATRQEAATLLGCDVGEIAFTKSTTRGIETVALGLKWNPGDVVVVEEQTFPANWYPWQAARLLGAETWTWPRRGPGYALEDLEARLRQGGVRLIAATSAHFATGFRQDLAAVGALARQYGALLCVDGIQTVGAFPTPVRELGIDFLAADSHKWLLGPEGAGLLYVAREHLALFRDDFIGWYGKSDFNQYRVSDAPPDATARRFEDGSPNVSGNMAMGESLRLFNKYDPHAIARKVLALRDALEAGLRHDGWQIISPGGDHRSGILAAHHHSADIDALVRHLATRQTIATNRGGNLRLAPHFYQSLEEMETVISEVGSYVRDHGR